MFKNIGERKKDVDKVKVGKKSLCRHKGGKRERKDAPSFGTLFFFSFLSGNQKKKKEKVYRKGRNKRDDLFTLVGRLQSGTSIVPLPTLTRLRVSPNLSFPC